MKILFVLKDLSLKEKINLTDFKEIKYSFVVKEELKKSDFKDKDLIVSIGGDGTFLSASHFIDTQLILGVNSNKEKSEGALTCICIQNLNKKLNEIISKKYKIKDYTREKVKIFKKNECIQTELALNEAYFGNINPHHPSNYILKTKDIEEKQRSSGILITTGTGSTAWYKAMKGSPFDREELKLKFKVREPFSGRIYKTSLIDGEILKNEILILESAMNHCLVAIDSIRVYDLYEGDKVEISIGSPLRAIQ